MRLIFTIAILTATLGCSTGKESAFTFDDTMKSKGQVGLEKLGVSEAGAIVLQKEEFAEQALIELM